MDLDPTGSPDATGSGHRKSVPYGQACTNCSKAKCKCISRGGPGATCDRCQRLGKECLPSVSVRKRAVRRPASERTAHLEEKLDDLVQILRAQAAGNPAPAVSYRSAGNAEISGANPNGDSNAASIDLDPCIAGKTDPNSGQALPLSSPIVAPIRYPSVNSYPTPPSVASSRSYDVGVSPAEADEALRLFRDQFLPFFPFVHIPRDTTPAQLQQSRPLLWMNVVIASCKSPPRKIELGLKFREIMSQKMLIDLDRDIDMLLGLLAFLGWAMHHFSGKPYIVAFTNLAVTVVTDLRLDKPPHDNFFRELHCFKPSYPYPKVGLSTNRTHEERRATLSLYVFCCGISNFLRTQAMRWTAHMEDSLQKLAANPECLNDEVLVTMVRTCRIQEDVAQVTWRSFEPCSNSTSSRAPPFVYVKPLRANLEAIKRDLPPALADNKVVQSHLCVAELSIADMTLWNVNPWLTTHPHRPPASAATSHVDVPKLEAYYASLQASKACLENFLSFQVADYFAFSFSLTLHFGRSAQTLYRLMVVDDPEWDRAIVRNSIDLMGAMEQAANKYTQVPPVCGVEPTGDDPEHMDYFTKAANALRATVPMWSATLEQVVLGIGQTGPAPPPIDPNSQMMSGVGIPVGVPVGEYSSMDWMDDPWLTDMMQSWEGQVHLPGNEG
ncbi:hypothetical protein GGR54DRAFT_645021 [Hypoxylon sp. NC1633]|nr:hypothetical protein GGR54DRAFT_645021 [Hypoxylon sp. NC1633]